MKHLSFVLVLAGCYLFSNGQMTVPSAFSRPLTPPRGHYKTLAALNPKPVFSGRDLDSVKYPLDKKLEGEVLSDKPVYLHNQSLDDFQLPAPPANSSEQTHAELNYLLDLQKTRTPEDVRSSLYMSNVFETPSDVGRSIGCWAAPQHLAPDFTDVFIAKADAMAHARQIIGVHFPSDCEVSRIFARQFVTKLF